MCWRHLPVSNVHGNIFKYKTACQVHVYRHLWKWGRIFSQHFVLMQYRSCSKVKQSSITLALSSDFYYWIEIWVSYMGKEILTVLVIWDNYTVIRLHSSFILIHVLCISLSETHSLFGSRPAEVLDWGYCPSCSWCEEKWRKIYELREDHEEKSMAISMRKREC